MNKKLISIVLPIFNEEKNISILYHELKTVFSGLSKKYDFELVMVNDGSTDSSWESILNLAHNDFRIRALNFSRNFGHQTALTAGYEYASGDAIITMDSDLQHPPSLIPSMLEAWQRGADIVYIQNTNRTDTLLKRISSKWYYKLLDKISDVPMPHDVADFRLIDSKVLKVLHSSKEKARYLRGMVAWTGFSHHIIPASFPKRKEGHVGYTWKKMFKLAFDGIASFSIFPLRLAAYVGFFVIITGILMFLYISIDAFLFAVYYPLFKWLVTIIYIFIGVLFILMWFLGEYIGRMYEELKGRPLYIIKDTYYTSSKKKEFCEPYGLPIDKSTKSILRVSKNRNPTHRI